MKTQQQWSQGDVFLVTLQDRSSLVAQIVGQERQVLNSVTCAFFDWRIKSSSEIAQISKMPTDKLFSLLFVTRDLLDAGIWAVVAHCSIGVPTQMLPFENLRKGGFVGAKVFGAGNVIKFLNAFYALSPWNQMKDPNYFDKFLVSPEKKPAKLIWI
jgi:hypothetical protein